MLLKKRIAKGITLRYLILNASSKYLLFILKTESVDNDFKDVTIYSNGQKHTILKGNLSRPRSSQLDLLKNLDLARFKDDTFIINLPDIFNKLPQKYILICGKQVIYNSLVSFYNCRSSFHNDYYLSTAKLFAKQTHGSSSSHSSEKSYDFAIICGANTEEFKFFGRLLSHIPLLFHKKVTSGMNITISNDINNLGRLSKNGRAIVSINFQKEIFSKYSSLVNEGRLLFTKDNLIMSGNQDIVNSAGNFEILMLSKLLQSSSGKNNPGNLTLTDITFNLQALYEYWTLDSSNVLPVFIQKYSINESLIDFSMATNMRLSCKLTPEQITMHLGHFYDIAIILNKTTATVFAKCSASLKVKSISIHSKSFDEFVQNVYASGLRIIHLT